MEIEAVQENWNLREPFSISRGSKSIVEVIKVTVTRNKLSGTGECVPYSRYQQDVSSTLETISESAKRAEVA